MSLPSRCDWIKNEHIRPYFFVRKENWLKNPGSYLSDCDWFEGLNVLKRDPLSMREAAFAKLILEVETRAFHQSGMPMPGWVFYDCGLIPGVVAGFAYKTSELPDFIRKIFGEALLTTEWTPLSLFIAIPCANKKEWVAHNLSSINALLPADHKFYGLGFLTKAFALWYSNINQLCGMTQWHSPALKLHSYYGEFEVLTAYTPVHSYPTTMTYRCQLDFEAWKRFFTRKEDSSFQGKHNLKADFSVHPNEVDSLVDFQAKIEKGEGPFYLDPDEIRHRMPLEELKVYTLK